VEEAKNIIAETFPQFSKMRVELLGVPGDRAELVDRPIVLMRPWLLNGPPSYSGQW
jgi:hypothetical protein